MSWPRVRLGFVADLLQTGPFGSQLHADEYVDDGVAVLNPAELAKGVINLVKAKKITATKAESLRRHRLRDGDVIVARRGEMGRCGLIRRREAGAVCGTGCLLMRLDSARVDGRFAALWFATEEVAWTLRAASVGSTMDNLNAAIVGRVAMPLPKLSVQVSVADFLDHKTAALDALIDKKTQLLTLLAEKRAALINRAVTRGLDPDAPMKRSGIAWIGEIPAHWQVKQLKFIAQVRGGVTKGQNNEGYEVAVLPYLRVANVQDGYLDLHDIRTIEVRAKDVDRYRLRPGDVLMNEGGDNDKLGRGAVWAGQIRDCLHQNHVFAVRPQAGVDPDWINLTTQSAYLKHFFYRRANQSTNLASISSSNLKEAPIFWPPIEEQQEIQGRLRAELARTASTQSLLSTQVSRLKEYRQALITAAVTGQLAIPDRASDVSILPGLTDLAADLDLDGPA